ncbi:F0F1 ATP synthase subunit delta [Ammoniphilus sp. CFH 90114]|uniref:F0F1 ATP synthase subunit delta n=1 Tax=Ammoniphilus sp. CFH 90114 TaxID=2493665 RepID=UPI00100FEE8C|nr:F0F1 ATP synthase subunit delta [Ammoniphilus sp. CFH 90114]RXT01119.1 F0F1 ATP synthase subunit delta [Ammoniphilus sp. CFH 90114]
MSSALVAKRYAQALFEVASEKQQIDLVEQELDQVKQLFNDNPAFLQFLQHPQLAGETKKQEVKAIFEGKLSEITLNFLNLLIDKKREDIFAIIPQYFTDKANEARGLVDAVVVSVKELTEAEKQGIAESFKKLLNKEVRVTNQIDQTIMGGVVVQVGDRLYDGSVAGRLNRLQQSLKQAQVR